MRPSIVIAALLLAGLQRQVVGQTVEIPLPELTGEFKGYVHQSTSVHLKSRPDSVRHVWMRLIGVVTPGLVECALLPDRPCPAHISVATWDAVGRAYWFADALVPKLGEIGVQEPFDVTFEFRPMTGATWETVMSGEFTVSLEAITPAMVGLCRATPAHGTMAQVWMIIEGDFQSAVSPSTWGRVKSLWID